MGRITNKELAEELYYIKGKLDSGEEYAREHRSWEVSEMNKIQGLLVDQNGRIRKNENTLSWFKGIFLFISGAIGFIYKKIL